MNRKQIIRYINNEMDAVERRKTIEWIRKSPENQQQYSTLKAAHVAASFTAIQNSDSDFFLEQLKNSIQKKKRRNTYIYGIVAMGVLFLFLWNYKLNNHSSGIYITEQAPPVNNIAKEEIAIVTQRGDKKEIDLPDGSKIFLNADSKLIYPSEFNDTIREVSLIGEAFFDIKKDVHKPFIVNTSSIKVRVLGTSFNIKSYAKDKKVETTLVTGKVELIKDKGTPIILAPSQKAIFHKAQNKLEIEKVKSLEVVAWKDGTLIFNKTPLKEVITDLERKYNVKISVNSQKLLNHKYTGAFDNLSITEVLNLLAISTPIKYTYENNNIILE